MVATDLSTQQVLGADPKITEQINFTWNLDGANNRVIFFIIEVAKETFLDFLQGIMKVLWIYFVLKYKISIKSLNIMH